ncbi:MAG: dTDP-4-amino-4,6-dideoxygalactose transaminase [Bacteroidia bacterium]
MTATQDFIPFNRPFIIGKELEYIANAVAMGQLSANGAFTQRCQQYFSERYKIKNLLTTSCTDALELAALLLDIQQGDEIIAPSFSYISTVNPFVLRGAKIIFADSSLLHPNIDADKIEDLITPQTKAIVCVHYAGMACDMEKLLAISVKHGIPIIEDAAHAIESKWKGGVQLGTIGQLGAFSFHETKNIIAGEGGLLCVNDEYFFKRAEVLVEKGTSRRSFFRGEVNKYEWIDVGSSFLPSELTAAYLFAQLEEAEKIQKNRIDTWNLYHELLEPVEKTGSIKRPFIPEYAMSNGHIYYIVCASPDERVKLTQALAAEGIQAVFHYQSLHKSPYYAPRYHGSDLLNADRYSDCLLRLPVFYGITQQQVRRVCSTVSRYFGLPE